MRRKKNQKTNNPSLKDYLEGYDKASLIAALNSFEGSIGWELLKAYGQMVQRRYEVDALDLIPKQDMVQAAAYASGYAKGVSDLLERFIPGLKDTVTDKSQVLENDRPEE